MDRRALSDPTLSDAARAELESRTRVLFEDSIAVKQQVLETQIATLVRMAEAIAQSLRGGGKLLLCGNGGSAADAQHLAAELLVRLRPHVNREGVPALYLATDMASLTACANDYGFDFYYERMVRTLGRSGDVLLGITTSGKSPNVLRALDAAQQMGLTRMGFLGGDGGPALALCDLAVIVPSKVTGRIQESHITAGHALMELVEQILIESGQLNPEE